jgi:hypothetical protein
MMMARTATTTTLIQTLLRGFVVRLLMLHHLC